MHAHILLRNGFPVVLVFGLWLPACKLSMVVSNELTLAAAYIAVSTLLLRACMSMRRRFGAHERGVFVGIGRRGRSAMLEA